MTEITREDILKQVNHIMIAVSKLTSNATEALHAHRYNEKETAFLLESLLPANATTGYGRHIITLALAILDNGQATFINVVNLYYLARRDGVLPLQMLAMGYGELYEISGAELMKLFPLTVGEGNQKGDRNNGN